MSEIASIAAAIFKRAGKSSRFIVAVAGPPGSGKSLLAERLHEVLPHWQRMTLPIHLVYPSRRLVPRRLSAFMDAIAGGLKATPA